jgi:DNA-binding XRE family transcriptional regulator
LGQFSDHLNICSIIHGVFSIKAFLLYYMPQRTRLRNYKALNIFATNMRRIRQSQGLTMQQLSDLMGVEYVQVANMELGKRDPTLSMFLHVANSLKVSVHELLEEYPSEPLKKQSQS